MTKVVIIGGGFAGVGTARALQGRLPPGSEILLYSRLNHIVFTPLLTEVVGAAINPLHAVWPLREFVRRVECRTARVVGIEQEARQIRYEGEDGTILTQPYDHLVLAVGQPARLDLVPGLAQHGWTLKTLGDAFELRNRLIQQLERAELEPDPERRAALLSFVVLGGGFTGVEIAGSAYDMLVDSCRYYQRIDKSQIRVVVVQGGDRILPPMLPSLSELAAKRMREAGVEIRLKTRAREVTAEGVKLENGEFIVAPTVVAAIGNGINPLVEHAGLPLERGRLQLQPDMRVVGHDNIWALGDCANVINAHDNQVSPTLAQFATRQATRLGKNILAALDGRPGQPFRYTPEGLFALIGHRNAVGQAFGLRFSGFPAWFMWHAIYWAKMPSVTRRLQIAIDWTMDLMFPRDVVQIDIRHSKKGEPDA